MSEDERFRAGVGLLVINEAADVLAIERSKNPGAWQLPQGGLHVGETPLDGAYRELEEETGLARDQVELVAERGEWLAYELPAELRTVKTGLGQVQKWFLFRFAGPDSLVRLSPDGEARAWAWRDLRELADATAEFRQHVYRELATWIDEHL
jgi:putative (di)nucleoside polyphosphate hydrolase